MAGKITDLAELTVGNAVAGDLMEIVDVSDTSMAATGTNKKILWSSIKSQMLPKYVRLSADRTSTSTALADVTGLSISIEANKVYTLRACIRYKSSTATESLGLAINGPASPTSVESGTIITGYTGIYRSEQTSGYDTTVIGVSSTTTSMLATIDSLIVNGANAGTLVVRFRAETGGANSVTVEAGSWFTLQEVVVP